MYAFWRAKPLLVWRADFRDIEFLDVFMIYVTFSGNFSFGPTATFVGSCDFRDLSPIAINVIIE